MNYLEKYFQGMNQTDLEVRNCSSKDECIEKYIKTLRLPTATELKSLNVKTNQLDKLYIKLSKIPWKFVIFKENENGFPHTHGDAIFIPEDMIYNISSLTLLHEKIHVFQRLYPCETHQLLLNILGFSFYVYDYGTNNCRSNPDKNDIVYKDETGQIVSSMYTSDAKHLTDIIDSRDHPYEIMAYLLSNNQNRSTMDPRIIDWMEKYLL